MGSGFAADQHEYLIHYVGFQRADIALTEERQLRKRVNQEQLLRWIAVTSGGAIGLFISNYATISALVGADPLLSTMRLLALATVSSSMALCLSLGQMTLAETLLRACLHYYASVISKQEVLVKAGSGCRTPLDELLGLNKVIDDGVRKAYEETGLMIWAAIFRHSFRWTMVLALGAFGVSLLPALMGLASGV